MAVTEKELEQKRKRLAKLREQTVEARARRVDNERAVSNELTEAQLDAEIKEQEALLEREREYAKISTIRDGSKNNLEQAKLLMGQVAGDTESQAVLDAREAVRREGLTPEERAAEDKAAQEAEEKRRAEEEAQLKAEADAAAAAAKAEANKPGATTVSVKSGEGK